MSTTHTTSDQEHGPAPTEAPSRMTKDGLWEYDHALPVVPGAEHPVLLSPEADLRPISRSFAFLDLAGFTSYTANNGDLAAVELLTLFRFLTKEVCARRRVRIAKWLGDGVLVIGIRPDPLIATIAELVGRFTALDIATRAGLATGPVIIFDGDDYIGQPVNLAARLEALARPGEILADNTTATAAPAWVVRKEEIFLPVRGLEDELAVQSLIIDPTTVLPEIALTGHFSKIVNDTTAQ